MADSISFTCPSCQKRYRVAGSYAGRNFRCKQCKNPMQVPEVLAADGPAVLDPGPDDSRIEMGGGQVVMRKTDSGRVVSVAPTRRFERQRETSAIAAPESSRASSKLPLIVVSVLVVVLGGGGTALVLGGVFDSGDAGGSGATPSARGNSGGVETPKQTLSDRDRILKEMEAPGTTGAGLVRLFNQGKSAKLSEDDLRQIGARAVDRLNDERGGTVESADLLAFGKELAALGQTAGPKTIYGLVVARGDSSDDGNPAAEYLEAQKLLGRELIDYTLLVERAVALTDVRVLEGAIELKARIAELDAEFPGGWTSASALERLGKVREELDEMEAELVRIRTEEPHRLQAALAETRMRRLRATRRGTWSFVAAKPFAILYQHLENEDEESAEYRMDELKSMLAPLYASFQEHFVKACELKRVLPLKVPDGAKREQLPFEIIAFKDKPHWRNYLTDIRGRVTDPRTTFHIDYKTGRLSLVHVGGRAADLSVLGWTIYSLIWNHHPRAPKNAEEAEAHNVIVSEFLSVGLIPNAGSMTTGAMGEFEFFQEGTGYYRTLGRLRGPAQPIDRRGVRPIGGTGFGARDLIEVKDTPDKTRILRANLKKIEGLPEETIEGNASLWPNTIYRHYGRGLFSHLYHFKKEDGAYKYRAGLRKFIAMDLKTGFKDKDQVEEFTKALGLNEAGWKTLEEEFLAIQKP